MADPVRKTPVDAMPAEGTDAQTNEQSNWLKRKLASWVGRPRGRDVIAANIGESARWVIVGKYNIQIGHLVLPTLPVVLTLVLIIASTATYLWFKLVPAEMPISPMNMNIAIAQVGLSDSTSKLLESKDGSNLSEWIYRALISGYAEFPFSQPVIWHDSMSLLRKRATIGLIEGSTPQERTDSAAALAERIKANMVIYGVMSAEGNQAFFTPEFYVADVLSQADELVGPHQLGNPIRLQLPFDPFDMRTSAYLRAELGDRVEALTWLSRAIVEDTNGRHSDALAVLEQAGSELRDWDYDEGKEILYYFIGREALYLSRQDPSWLARAEDAYLTALEINPGYARAHFGLGGVYYSLAQVQGDQLVSQADTLDLAMRHYELAIAQASTSPGSNVELKAQLGLGTVLRLLGQDYLEARQYESAAAVLDDAIQTIEEALPMIKQADHRLLAEAYLALGAAYHQQAYISQVTGDELTSLSLYQQAEAAYSECIRHAEADLYDSSSQDQKAKGCEPYRLDVLEAIAGLEALR